MLTRSYYDKMKQQKRKEENGRVNTIFCSHPLIHITHIHITHYTLHIHIHIFYQAFSFTSKKKKHMTAMFDGFKMQNWLKSQISMKKKKHYKCLTSSSQSIFNAHNIRCKRERMQTIWQCLLFITVCRARPMYKEKLNLLWYFAF